MTWKEIVGARFSPAEFDDYVGQLVFTAWRPQFVVVHNTGIPALADRPVGFTQTHIQNFVHYYRDTQNWSAGPHCFIDQNGIWVFTPLTTSGVHSPSWNLISWGVETLGDYSTEAFTDPIHEHLVACLASLHAVVPLDVNNLRFHKEDPLTDHDCPGVNIIKVPLIHDVRELMSSRHTLAHPASGRYSGVPAANLAPQSHFFADHTILKQTEEIAYGPVSGGTQAEKESKFRVTSLFKVDPNASANAEVRAYAVVSGMIMLQRVADPAVPGSYRANVVNLVIKPYQQAMLGFTPVRYFIYRNLRLDDFLEGDSADNEKLVRPKAGSSVFIQNSWVVHTAWNGAVPFESTKLGYDPANQPGADKIDRLFYRENSNEQLPFVARGDDIGKFYVDAGADEFGFEIVLEGDFQPDYDYVRKYKEVIIDVSGLAGTDKKEFTARLERERILDYIDPAAFFSMHMATGGWLQVKDGAGKKKLPGIDVYDQVITKFSTRNTLYLDIRNENGRSLNFYSGYDDGSGNALEVGDTAASLTAQKYASDKWPLIIRPSSSAANAKDHNLVFLRLRRDYNKKPILYLGHGEPDEATTKGRFIADTDLFAAADPTTSVIGFRFPNKDLGSGNRIGVAWLLRMDYAMRQDAANSPFPANVIPTATYLDSLFGPIDINLPWAVSNAVIAWAKGQDKKYVDGESIAGLGFEHIADRGVAFSNWTGAASTAGSVLFYAAAKDTFANRNSSFVPHGSLASGVSNRDSFFEEAMLFDSYSVEFDVILDGTDQVSTMKLKKAQPRPKPPEAMLLMGLTRAELETLKALTGFDSRYPRNLLLREVAGSPFTDTNGATYSKYRVGLNGMNDEGAPHEAFPVIDLIAYTSEGNFFFSKAFTAAQPPPKAQERNCEELIGLDERFGDTYDISAAAGDTVTVTAPTPVPATEPPIDITREIVPGDLVTINSELYNVVNVSAIAGGAVITLDVTPVAVTPGTDKLRAPNKNLEDYYIAKDRLGVLSGINRMEVLVADFGASLSVVPNDTTAPASIEALVNDYGPKILQRARLICRYNDFSYPDDRILYWARIKMMVRMKNHPYLRSFKNQKDTLVKLFETKSRGYDGVTFGAAGSRKKMLIAGFDPYHIADNKMRSNPSGAAVLALHDQNHTLDGISIHIQSAIFPNRYADFDGKDFDGNDFEGIQSPTGVVESFFEQFIDPAISGVKPELIVTLSQGQPLEFWVDRFASRTRGETYDNMCREHIPFPKGVDGDPFYETKLDATKMVPADNKCGDFKVFYNNIFWYMWDARSKFALYPKEMFILNPATGKLIEEPNPPQPDSGALKIEDLNHPEHQKLWRTFDPTDPFSLFALVPSALTEATSPKKSEITPGRGSGGHYFSNEIFYRVSRLRDKHNSSMITGHYHVPQIQHDTIHDTTWPRISAANSSVTTSEHFDADLLRRMILEIRDGLVRAGS